MIMERTSEHIESVLRSAPVPVPPADLKSKLLSQARDRARARAELPGNGNRAIASERGFQEAIGGWRRWMLLVLPAGAAVALGATVLVQQQRLEDLRDALGQSVSARSAAAPAPVETAAPSSTWRALPNERREIERLRALVAALEKDAEAVRQLEQENSRLKAAIAAGRKTMPAELQELVDARDRAGAIQCVNNMKQMGLAVRIYANDHQEEYPPDYLSMADLLNTPKILVCPADSGRTAADAWTSFSSANVSYEFLSPGPGKHEFEPSRVLFRCPIHGHIGLCDGSVQMNVARERPEDLVSRNGVLYMESQANAPSKARPSTPGRAGGAIRPGGMPEELARRYGLVEATNALVPVEGTAGGGTLERRSFEMVLEKDGQPVKVVRTVLLDAHGNEVEVNDAGVVVPDGSASEATIETVTSDEEDRP